MMTNLIGATCEVEPKNDRLYFKAECKRESYEGTIVAIFLDGSDLFFLIMNKSGKLEKILEERGIVTIKEIALTVQKEPGEWLIKS